MVNAPITVLDVCRPLVDLRSSLEELKQNSVFRGNQAGAPEGVERGSSPSRTICEAEIRIAGACLLV